MIRKELRTFPLVENGFCFWNERRDSHDAPTLPEDFNETCCRSCGDGAMDSDARRGVARGPFVRRGDGTGARKGPCLGRVAQNAWRTAKSLVELTLWVT